MCKDADLILAFLWLGKPAAIDKEQNVSHSGQLGRSRLVLAVSTVCIKWNLLSLPGLSFGWILP